MSVGVIIVAILLAIPLVLYFHDATTKAQREEQITNKIGITCKETNSKSSLHSLKAETKGNFLLKNLQDAIKMNKVLKAEYVYGFLSSGHNFRVVGEIPKDVSSKIIKCIMGAQYEDCLFYNPHVSYASISEYQCVSLQLTLDSESKNFDEIGSFIEVSDKNRILEPLFSSNNSNESKNFDEIVSFKEISGSIRVVEFSFCSNDRLKLRYKEEVNCPVYKGKDRIDYDFTYLTNDCKQCFSELKKSIRDRDFFLHQLKLKGYLK